MATSVTISNVTLTEGNAAVSAIMPAYTYLRDMSVVNFSFTCKWSGFSKVTSIEPLVGIYNGASSLQHFAWLLAKEEKTTSTSGTKTYTGQMFVPQLSSMYGPGLTSLADGTYWIKFDFCVNNSSSGIAADTQTLCITYATLKAPIAETFDVYRATSAGVKSDEGTYIRYSVKGSISPILSTDRGTFVLRYRLSSTSTWSSITLGSSVTSVNISSAQLPITCAISISCELELVITDRYSSVTIAKTVPTASVLMHFKADKSGIGIGKYAETSNLLDISLPTRLRSTVNMDIALPITSGGTGATTGSAAMTSLGFGGIKMTGVSTTGKMSSTSTCYISYYTVDNYTSGVVVPWAASGQSYYNGCRVLQAGWYIFNGRLVWDDVTASTHGRLMLAAMPSNYESLITATLSGSNALPASFTQYATDYYNAYTDYETASSLSAKATKIMYLPANAVVVVYYNAQTANFTRGGGFFELCRIG